MICSRYSKTLFVKDTIKTIARKVLADEKVKLMKQNIL